MHRRGPDGTRSSARPVAARPHPGRDAEAWDRSVRRAYLVVLAVPLVLVVAGWVVTGPQDAYTRVVFPTVVVVHSGLILATWARRLPLRTVGACMFLSPAAVLAGRLVAWDIDRASRPEDLGVVVVGLAWFGVVFALAFVAFGTRGGGVVGITGSLALYGWAATSLAGGGVLSEVTPRTVAGLAGAHATLIAVVWVLARSVEQLAAARTRADLLSLLADTDPLTGVANRRRLEEEAHRLFAQARRYGHPLSVIVIDLDHFKTINDTYGHETGDLVLVGTVERMLEATRGADLLGRWGGDEFVLLAPHTDLTDACELAERCREAVRRVPADGLATRVTASLGVATFQPNDDVPSLLRRVDRAMYMAKDGGRDCVRSLPDAVSSDMGASA